MGFFQKKKEDVPKAPPKSAIEKIVMGAIVGTAIGSVIGLAVAPKSGKETREMLKEADLTKLTKETVTGLGTLAKKLLFGNKKSSEATPELKQIPRETPSQESAQKSRNP